MKEDEVMKDAPPLEGDLEDDTDSIVLVMPDSDKVMEVVRCTQLRGNSQRVNIHLRVNNTKTLKSDSYFTRIKTAFEKLFSKKEMELSVVVKDESKEIYSMTDFPATFRTLTRWYISNRMTIGCMQHT